MSGAIKQAKHKKKMAAKRAAKAARHALYKSYAESGNNQKSKRNKLRSKRKATVRNSRHALGPCNNVGCKKCSPVAQMLAIRKAQRGTLKR